MAYNTINMKSRSRWKISSVGISVVVVVVVVILAGVIPDVRVSARQQNAVNFSDPNHVGYLNDAQNDLFSVKSVGEEKGVYRSPSNRHVIKLAVLLPDQNTQNEGCNDCVLKSVLPVIDLGIWRISQMLNGHLAKMNHSVAQFDFQLLYGDTQCSSSFGPLIAVNMVNYQRPGVFLANNIGEVKRWILAQCGM